MKQLRCDLVVGADTACNLQHLEKGNLTRKRIYRQGQGWWQFSTVWVMAV